MKSNKFIWLLAGTLVGVAITEFARSPGRVATAQDAAKQPFANSIDQRQQTVEELRKLNALMQKQLDLLSSGKVRVVVVDDKAEGERDANGMKKAFTLIEVLIVVVVLAIIASVVVPALNDSSSSQLRGAAIILARDIQYVQSEAINTGQTLQLEFTGATRYRAIDPDGGPGGTALILPHPQADSPAHNGQFIVDFGDPGMLKGVTIASAQFGGVPRLEFGRYGETISGGEVIVRVRDCQVRITVAPATGIVTIGRLEAAGQTPLVAIAE